MKGKQTLQSCVPSQGSPVPLVQQILTFTTLQQIKLFKESRQQHGSNPRVLPEMDVNSITQLKRSTIPKGLNFLAGILPNRWNIDQGSSNMHSKLPFSISKHLIWFLQGASNHLISFQAYFGNKARFMFLIFFRPRLLFILLPLEDTIPIH